MKNILWLVASLFVCTACDNSQYDLENLVPEEYHKILYLNNSGKQEVTLYDTGEAYTCTFSVVKAGSDPGLAATATVTVMTQAELDEVYSTPEAVDYRLIGTDCYSLSATRLDFASADRYKPFTVSLNPSEIKAAIEGGDAASVWVLPLQVVSDTDSINSARNRMFLQITGVITPSLLFTSSEVAIKEYTYGGASVTENIPFGLDTENSWDIDVEFEVYDDYRTTYNSSRGTKYQALPEGTYTLDTQMNLPAGTTTTDLPVTLDVSRIAPGDYMLPVRIKSASMFDISAGGRVYPLTVRVLGTQLDRTNWTIEANTQENNGEGAGNGVPSCAIDGNLSTYWHSSWQSGTHALPHELIIDTHGSYTFTQFGLMQRQNATYTDTGAGIFYVSDDKENWTQVGTFSMEKILSLQNFTVDTPMEGRYFKVQITASNRGVNTSLTEIYAYGL